MAVVRLFLLLISIFFIDSRVMSDKLSQFNKIICVDRSFNDEELGQIMVAANEWTSKTNNIVHFEVVPLPTNKILNIDDIILILNVNDCHPNIFLLDSINENSTLGFYNRNSVIISIEIVEKRIMSEDFSAVVKHELGHSIGLMHNKNLFTLMYPSLDFAANIITDRDLKEFCKLYYCGSKLQKYF